MKTRIERLVVVVALIAAACGGAAPQSTTTQNLDITFKSEPDPPKMGENTFEAMVMANGQPVSDADVAVEFFMAAMPSMNMAEMRNSVPLKHEGEGRYRGAGNVMMAGAWDATVTVKRGGQDLGSKKFSVTAK
jgi:uncharacterized GH25 family protein